jgi:YfiH family protein
MYSFFTDVRDGNLALHVKDNPLEVFKNRERLKQKLQCENLVFMEQVHTDNIIVISDKNDKTLKRCDALVTNLKGVALCVMVADCIPIIIHDSLNEVIAVVHAGRNGSFLEIAKKVVNLLQDKFTCKAESLHVELGPCIKKCCYEVGVALTKGYEEFTSIKEGRYYLDLVSLNKKQLLSMGVQEENIKISSICTCCDENYFSYRRDKQSGRFCGVVQL